MTIVVQITKYLRYSIRIIKIVRLISLSVFSASRSNLASLLIWWTKPQQKAATQTLSSIQRLGNLCITRATRTTPTGALENQLNLPPLDSYKEGLGKLI